MLALLDYRRGGSDDREPAHAIPDRVRDLERDADAVVVTAAPEPPDAERLERDARSPVVRSNMHHDVANWRTHATTVARGSTATR